MKFLSIFQNSISQCNIPYEISSTLGKTPVASISRQQKMSHGPTDRKKVSDEVARLTYGGATRHKSCMTITSFQRQQLFQWRRTIPQHASLRTKPQALLVVDVSQLDNTNFNTTQYIYDWNNNLLAAYYYYYLCLLLLLCLSCCQSDGLEQSPEVRQINRLLPV